MSKKVIGALLAIALVLSVFSFSVFAAGTGYDNDPSHTQTWGFANKTGSDGTYTVEVLLTTTYDVGPLQFQLEGVDKVTKVEPGSGYYPATAYANESGLISIILMCATEVIVYGLKSSSAYDETYNIFKLLDMGTGSDTGDAAMGCTIAGVVCGGIGVLLLLLAVAGSNVKAGCASGAGVCLIIYLICMIVSVYAILSDGKPDSIKFGFGVMGWIAIAVGLIGAITAFAAASQAKKKMATAPIRF